jgi:exodeoxyribonuclease VII small subunit
MPMLKKLEEAKLNENISFEEKLEMLREIVESLEEGEIPLKESMEKYQESLNLIKECSEELDGAELKIKKIMKSEGKINFKNL